MNFVSPSPPQAHLNVEIMPQFVEAVNQAAGGELDVQLRTGGQMANAGNVYDRLQSDVIQIAFSPVPQLPKSFPLLSAVELPFIIPDAETGSEALWNLVESGALDADFEGLKVLGITAFPSTTIHTNADVGVLDDVAGLRLAGSGQALTSLIQELGAAPISLNVSDQYQAIDRGTVDGTVMIWTAFQPFRLAEVTSHHVEGPFGSAVAMVFMTEEKFESLSPTAQAALEQAGGREFSRQFGAFWDRVASEAREQTAALEGHEIVDLSDQDIEVLREKSAAVIEAWKSSTEGGPEFLDALEAEIAAIQAR
ncbi:TRAP transporter substrate-binding protein [Pelagibacterium halotolerans]|nr:TRAP transporter substrate-binding protein [Pelagibacterium halotolerans]QJR18882.1 TRAP transporter substrate-binding protein [Pelagibacterium halotolerans]